MRCLGSRPWAMNAKLFKFSSRVDTFVSFTCLYASLTLLSLYANLLYLVYATEEYCLKFLSEIRERPLVVPVSHLYRAGWKVRGSWNEFCWFSTWETLIRNLIFTNGAIFRYLKSSWRPFWGEKYTRRMHSFSQCRWEIPSLNKHLSENKQFFVRTMVRYPEKF